MVPERPGPDTDCRRACVWTKASVGRSISSRPPQTIAESRGCRVITVLSGAFKTIRSWLKTSLVVTVISRS